MWMSGWWPSASARSATLFTNFITRTKSLYVNSRQSRGSSFRSFHFGTCAASSRAAAGSRAFMPPSHGLHFFFVSSMLLGYRFGLLPATVDRQERDEAHDADDHRNGEQRLVAQGSP